MHSLLSPSPSRSPVSQISPVLQSSLALHPQRCSEPPWPQIGWDPGQLSFVEQPENGNITFGQEERLFTTWYPLCNLLKGGHSRSSCHGQGCYRWRHDHCTGCCLCIRYPQRTFWDACYDVFLFISCLPAAFVTMVTIRAVVVFSALRRTFSINASLNKYL